MKTLPIVWKRLVSEDGKTCERCGATHQEMQRAVSKRSVCGESECRTVEVGGTAFEAIPEEFFIRAALVAASTLIDAPHQPAPAPTVQAHPH
jgi:hypothetical protein